MLRYQAELLSTKLSSLELSGAKRMKRRVRETKQKSSRNSLKNAKKNTMRTMAREPLKSLTLKRKIRYRVPLIEGGHINLREKPSASLKPQNKKDKLMI